MLFFHFGQGIGVATDEANGPSLFQKRSAQDLPTPRPAPVMMIVLVMKFSPRLLFS